MPWRAAAKLVALVGMDPPDHEVQRRMLIPSFSMKRVNSPRPAPGPPPGHSERLGPGDPLTERELMLRKELPGRP
ncbi:DUF6059 family protein [Streptomyces sp. H27-S2]|uniref:DUF6059 family protein n=1 Tax=Streptomyces antarcticus TaxID=2996458 RepID=UPI00226DDDE5|nr:DUF6059 family protein [Streptomyces sp. H27-S2]MCY0949733.1 hypothetical protein [Streptomyces sp. H27-S2]